VDDGRGRRRDRLRPHRGVSRVAGLRLDSLIELVSASSILWLYTGSRSGSAAAERSAQQFVAVYFGVLALYVTVDAINTLAGKSHLRVAGREWWRRLGRFSSCCCPPAQGTA
jgi:hypothetical protein